jgi:2-iminobutanoate/2-iminopropanoate deaminase
VIRASAVARGGFMTRKNIETKGAPKPIGPYTQGVIAGGLLFASGQIPIDPETGQVIEGGIEAQTEQVFKNLLAVLKEAKMSTDNVVKTTVYLVDLADFNQMNDVYARFLGKTPPARSTIQAAALPRGVRVEIDLVAAF